MKRGGRPRTRIFRLGDRVPIGLRVSVALRDRLDKACKRSGRSIAQEIELRLERTFDRDDVENTLTRVLMVLGQPARRG